MQEHLFSDTYLHDVLARRLQSATHDVDAFNPDQLLTAPIEDICEAIASAYPLEIPRLNCAAITIANRDTQLDVSRDANRDIVNRTRPFYVPATEVTFHVPFEGDSYLFTVNPNSYIARAPSATVRGHELLIRVVSDNQDGERVRSLFQAELNIVESYLEVMTRASTSFASELARQVRNAVTRRREQLLKERDLVAFLGFPLRRRHDAPETFTTPQVRRRAPMMQKSPPKPFLPEPAIAAEEYENILRIMRSMVHVFERSPGAFGAMREEDLRTHFLVQLNGQYEGGATGETFNSSGKTDILVRERDRNLLVAECKFWDGPQSLLDAVTQLIGYATWRDAQLAVLMFNRKRDFSKIVAAIPQIMQTHPKWKHHVAYAQPTSWRCALAHPNDADRELTLTVLAFDVPS